MPSNQDMERRLRLFFTDFVKNVSSMPNTLPSGASFKDKLIEWLNKPETLERFAHSYGKENFEAIGFLEIKDDDK